MIGKLIDDTKVIPMKRFRVALTWVDGSNRTIRGAYSQKKVAIHLGNAKQDWSLRPLLQKHKRIRNNKSYFRLSGCRCYSKSRTAVDVKCNVSPVRGSLYVSELTCRPLQIYNMSMFDADMEPKTSKRARAIWLSILKNFPITDGR